MARKVNTRFLLITIIVVGVVAGAAGVAYKMGWLFHKDPRSYVRKGDELMNSGEYEQAAKYYATAALIMKDPAQYVKAGDVYLKLVYADQENYGNALKLWDGALQVDPAYVPALQRILTTRWEQVEKSGQRPPPWLLDNIRETSEKLLRADPDDRQARAMLPIVTVVGWISGVETEPQKIEDAIKAMQEEQARQPQNDLLPFYIAEARLEQARRVRNEDRAGYQQLADQAVQTMADAVKAQPDNVLMHLRAGQMFTLVSRANRDRERRNSATSAPASVAATQPADPLMDRARGEFDRARELSKPEDPRYVDVQLFAADAKRDNGDLAGAEKILRELIQQRPTELSARLELARFLRSNPQRRAEAVELLSAPIVPTSEQRSGMNGLMLKYLESETKAELVDIRLDQYGSITDPAQRAELVKQIQSSIDEMSKTGAEDSSVLRLKGKLELVLGDNVAALQTLTRAYNNMPSGDSLQRFDLMNLLAQANLRTGQSGQAKLLLQQIVDRTQYFPARLQLVRVLLEENDLSAAREQLKVLQEQQPENPEVRRLQIITLDPKTQKDQIQKLFAELPETSRAERIDKARIAMVTQQPEQMQRLLQAVLAENPGDTEAAGGLAQYLGVTKKDTKAALAILDKALAANPSDPRLTVLRQQLSSPGGSIEQNTEAAISKLPPYEQELARAERARMTGNETEAEAHYKKALGLNPKDPRALQALFASALGHKQFDVAQGYLDQLAAPDVNGDKVGGQFYRWQFAMAKNDLPTALDLSTRLTRENGMFAQSWLALAKTQYAMSHFDEAISGFQTAREKQPTNVEAWQGLIACAEAMNRYNDSKQYIDDAQKIFRGDQTFAELANEWEMNHGDISKVLAARQEAVKSKPDDLNNWQRLGQALNAAAEKAAKAKDQDKANQYLAQARDAYAQALVKFPDDLRLLVGQVMASAALKDVASGEKALSTASARDAFKDKPEFASLAADFYNRVGKPDQAEKALADYLAKPAAANAPGELQLRLQLGNLYLSQKKYDDALKALGDSNDPRLAMRKFDVLMAANRIDEAQTLMKNLLATAGNDSPDANTYKGALAVTYLHSGHPKEALDLLNKVVAADPKNPAGLLYRARAMLMMPRPNLEQIGKDLATARDASPNDVELRYLLADVDGRRNDIEAQIRELEDILRIRPEEKRARLHLMSLYASTDPPRWVDAERVARDAAGIPAIANDPELLVAEANMWRAKGEPKRAIERLDAARKAGAANAVVYQTLLSVLIDAKQYQMTMQVTDQLTPQARDQWWVHGARGQALAGLGDNRGASQEFEAGMNQLAAAKDDRHAADLVQQMANAVGVDAALRQIQQRVASGNPGWVITAAQLYERKGDLPTARKLVDNLLADPSKLTPTQKVLALNYAGHAWIMDPNADMSKAKAAYLQLTALTPDDYIAWNNLACIKGLPVEESLKYSQRAFEEMQKKNVNEPYVLDTHGWNLIQAGRNAEGLDVLMTAWSSKQFPELAYHLGVAQKNQAISDHNPALLDEAERSLNQATALFGKAVERHEVADLHLQDDITSALREVRDLKSKQAQAN